MRLLPLSAAVAVIALAGCSAASSSSSSSAHPAAPAGHTAKPHKTAGTKAKPKSKSSAVDACYARIPAIQEMTAMTCTALIHSYTKIRLARSRIACPAADRYGNV